MGIFNEHSISDHQGHTLISNILLTGPPGAGYKLTSDGNYDIGNKLLKNVGNAKDNTDAVTKN